MRVLWLMIIIVLANACKDVTELPVPTGINSTDEVFSSDQKATGVLTGIYLSMNAGGIIVGKESMSVTGILLADESELLSADEYYQDAYHNELSSGYMPAWGELYRYIFSANGALEGLKNAAKITPAIRRQLLGEAFFMRAFCYFYLVNMFGDVPLVLTTDAQKSKSESRTISTIVYGQILSDLDSARQLLWAEYPDGATTQTTIERVRPVRFAAIALQARVYLYLHQFRKAIESADTVIGHRELYELTSLKDVFLKNSREAIWQLQPVNVNYSLDGYTFMKDKPVYISQYLLENLDARDKRRTSWLLKDGSVYYPCKYRYNNPGKDTLEYQMMFRLGELYLIRAEASLEMGDLTNAVAYLNVIRTRAGLPDIKDISVSALMDSIQVERQRELFSEWGHRWFDLIRTGTINDVMDQVTAEKGGYWKPWKALFPLPEYDLNTDKNLTQNPGY